MDPMACAFSGARVAEIAQLRKVDVRPDGAIPHIRITPDAGSVKTGQFRDVPLHPQLVQLGLLDFVGAAPDGPLFFNRQAIEKALGTLRSKLRSGSLSGFAR
jgi:integrase